MDEVAPPANQPPILTPTPLVLAFVDDRVSEGVIRQCFSDLGVANVEIVSGRIEKAIAELPRRPAPRLLIVDVAATSDPSAQLAKLSEVCEPSTGVVVIGDSNDIRLYRDLKAAGIVEYYFKPLVSGLMRQTCGAILTGGAEQRSVRTGKLVFALGVGGGAGSTTILANAAWHLAEDLQRHVVFVDLYLHSGDAALQLDVAPTHALREALEHPERVDELFLERGLIRVTKHLGLLASLEPLADTFVPKEQAVLTLIETLRRHYRYVLVDMPMVLAPRLISVLHLPSICLLISTASLVAARDVVRWREEIGANTVERSTLHLLNKSAGHGSLPMEDFVRVVVHPPDIVIPYAREVGLASNFGVKAVQKCRSFQQGLAPLLRHLSGESAEVPRSLLSRLFG